MDVTLHIPDDLARRFGTTGEIERRVLETLALDEYRRGHPAKPELRRLLGLATRNALDGFLKTHGVFEPYSPEELEHERRDLRRLGY